MTDLQREKELKKEIMDNFSSFFQVFKDAEDKAKSKNEKLTPAHVRASLKENDHLFLSAPKLTPVTDKLDQEAQLQKAKKQVELDNKIASYLGLFGMTPRLITEVVDKLAKANGQSAANRQELEHPKLKRNKAASSFLDAYKQFTDAVDSKDPEKVENAAKNVNELVLQYKNRMKNAPKLQAPKPQEKPQYVPRVKPTNTPG